MKLFFYYVTHTFKNQIKKLFRTWLLVFFLICGLVGGLIGFGASKLDQASEERNPESAKPTEPETSFEEETGVAPMEMTELVAGGVVLGLLVFSCISADRNGSRIFLPADVTLLFSSPMKPQSVLMFRLTTQMGVMIFASLWLLAQIPTIMNLGATFADAFAIVLTWIMASIMFTLVQVLLYIVCSTHISIKKYLRPGVFALIALLGAGYFAYWKSTDLTALQGACAFFNHPATRMIPLWGWLKGFCMYAIEGNWLGAVLSFAGNLLLGGAFLWLIWHIKADFYEDAMAKSQETAALLEAAQSEKTIVRKRKKDRSDKILRDGMGHGWGANIFFWKSLYNRFRFAHLGVFTKTSETYLAAACAAAIICRYAAEIPGAMPVMLTMAVISFFRALGNPLEEDTNQDFFRMIPETTWKKLFYSLLGGTTNCLLDMLPGLAAASLLLWENPLELLAWVPFIVSLDFFSTTVSAFINLSVPVSAGKMLKQYVTILFVYFGLLPDVGIMAAGIVYEQVVLAALGATALNLALGFTFLAFIPLFIEPKEDRKMNEESYYTGDLKPIKKQFSLMGLAGFLFLLSASAVQLLIGAVAPQWVNHPIGMWLCLAIPMYLVGFPIYYLLLKGIPEKPLVQKKMKVGHWLETLLICFCMMIAGNLVSTAVLALLNMLAGAQATNPLENLVMKQLLIPKILVVVIIGPIMEEIAFRKMLINRMHPYGEKLAVLTSAIAFGLFHGNLSQFFYAFALGLVFGFVYLKTGRLRYSIALHMFINFMGSVFAPFMLEHLNMEALMNQDIQALTQNLPWLLAFLGYTAMLYICGFAGLIILCVHHRKITFTPAPMELPRGKRLATVWGNVGMILLIVICIGLTLMTFT